jgi:hypothetical protein
MYHHILYPMHLVVAVQLRPGDCRLAVVVHLVEVQAIVVLLEHQLAWAYPAVDLVEVQAIVVLLEHQLAWPYPAVDLVEVQAIVVLLEHQLAWPYPAVDLVEAQASSRRLCVLVPGVSARFHLALGSMHHRQQTACVLWQPSVYFLLLILHQMQRGRNAMI